MTDDARSKSRLSKILAYSTMAAILLAVGEAGVLPKHLEVLTVLFVFAFGMMAVFAYLGTDARVKTPRGDSCD